MSRHGTSSTGNVCLYMLAIFLPPVAVLLRAGCGASFLINICLTILGWIPGVIHSWFVISRRERTKVVKTHHTHHSSSRPIMGGGGRTPMVQKRRRW